MSETHAFVLAPAAVAHCEQCGKPADDPVHDRADLALRGLGQQPPQEWVVDIERTLFGQIMEATKKREWPPEYMLNDIVADICQWLENPSPCAAPEMVMVPREVKQAVDWILRDAAFKAPEQIGEIAERWIWRLRTAAKDTP